MAFLDQIKQRRSIYTIGKNVSLEQAEIENLIKDAVKHSPSSFNSQTSRVVILFGQSHDTFWHIVRETFISSIVRQQHHFITGFRFCDVYITYIFSHTVFYGNIIHLRQC